MIDDRSHDIAAEFAEASHRGERGEFFDGDSYSFRRLGSLKDAAFDRMVNGLRASKWNREHPERRSVTMARYNNKPKVRDRQAELRRRRRAREAAKWPLLTCAECGKSFSRKRHGPKPRFCGETCAARARYQATTPGARRIARHGEQPATCTRPGCTKAPRAKRLCGYHYKAAWAAA